MMRKILPFLFLLISFCGFEVLGQTVNPGTGSGTTAPACLSQAAILAIIKTAARQFKMSSDVLYIEFTNGLCCIYVLDEKNGIYQVVRNSGGATIVTLESVF